MINQSQGFTLIEILVALALLATVLTASYTLEAQAINHLKRVKQQLIAHWVADNLISDIQLGIFPMTETLQGKTQLLQYIISWRMESSLLPEAQQKAYTLHLMDKTTPLQTVTFYEPSS